MSDNESYTDWLESVEDERAQYKNALAQMAARIAELEAELAPWREMGRQVDELRGDDFWISVVYKELYEPEQGYQAVFRCVRGATRGDHIGQAMTIPAAVDAAYRRVKGVGDE